MSRHFLAACLWAMAACMLALAVWIAAASWRRDRAAAISAVLAAAALAAILANAGADLW